MGGRRDIIRWAGTADKPVAELEIYHPGGELNPTEPATADIARRMDPGGHELEAAGIVDSKFGPVALFRVAGHTEDASACLGFLKSLDNPALKISGWTLRLQTKDINDLEGPLPTPLPTVCRAPKAELCKAWPGLCE